MAVGKTRAFGNGFIADPTFASLESFDMSTVAPA
jgi:hypothetical protein